MQRRMLQLKFMRQKLGQMTVTRSEGAGSSRLGGVNSDFHDCLGVSFAANTCIPPLDFIGCQTNPHSTHLPLPPSLGTLELRATWLQSISLERRHNELACKLSFCWSASPPSSSELSLSHTPRLLPQRSLVNIYFSAALRFAFIFRSALDKFLIILSYNLKSYSNFSVLFFAFSEWKLVHT